MMRLLLSVQAQGKGFDIDGSIQGTMQDHLAHAHMHAVIPASSPDQSHLEFHIPGWREDLKSAEDERARAWLSGASGGSKVFK